MPKHVPRQELSWKLCSGHAFLQASALARPRRDLAGALVSANTPLGWTESGHTNPREGLATHLCGTSGRRWGQRMLTGLHDKYGVQATWGCWKMRPRFCTSGYHGCHWTVAPDTGSPQNTRLHEPGLAVGTRSRVGTRRAVICVAPLGGVTSRTSKCRSRASSWRSAFRDTSQHAIHDLLEGRTLVVMSLRRSGWCRRPQAPHFAILGHVPLELCQVAGGCLGSWWPTALSWCPLSGHRGRTTLPCAAGCACRSSWIGKVHLTLSPTTSQDQLTWLDFLIGAASEVLPAYHRVWINCTRKGMFPDSFMMHRPSRSNLACGFGRSSCPAWREQLGSWIPQRAWPWALHWISPRTCSGQAQRRLCCLASPGTSQHPPGPQCSHKASKYVVSRYWVEGE